MRERYRGEGVELAHAEDGAVGLDAERRARDPATPRLVKPVTIAVMAVKVTPPASGFAHLEFVVHHGTVDDGEGVDAKVNLMLCTSCCTVEWSFFTVSATRSCR